MLTENTNGDYHFLPAVEPYSSGVVADPGSEILHVRLRESADWKSGFEIVDAALSAAGRPRAALCGVELRCPRPHPMEGFVVFNKEYADLLRSWDLLISGVNPLARTNVAPLHDPPERTHLYAFSYTREATAETDQTTFVVAGAGELHSREFVSDGIIRRGESSLDAMREKAEYVMGVMSKRIVGLGVRWEDATCVDVYTAHPVDDLLADVVLPGAGSAGRYGISVFATRPPIDEIEFEMDVRGVRVEEVV